MKRALLLGLVVLVLGLVGCMSLGPGLTGLTGTVTVLANGYPPPDGKTIVVVVKDSQGNPIQGAAVYLGVGGWPFIGNTGPDGILIYTHPTPLGNMRVKVTAPNEGGTETTPFQDVSVNNVFQLQTHRIVIRLLDHNGNPLNGGVVAIGHGGWPVIGTTGRDGPGVLYHEYFAGTEEFRMSYNYGTETKTHVHTAGGSTLTFQTGLVVLHFSGTIVHGVGGYPRYTGPTEMLPVEHRFGFSGPGYDRKELRFTPTAGAVLEKSVFYIRLRDSTGAGVAGGVVRLGVGGWPVIGSTDEDGVLLYARDGKVGNMAVRMSAPNNGGTQTSPVQNHATNSFYDFRTVRAVIQLKDSTGALVDGGVVRIGFGGWPVIGTTGRDGPGTLYHELFPGTYNFRMTAPNNGGTETKGQDISTPVVFQTHRIVIQLLDHNGSPLNGGKVAIGHGGWPVIGTTGKDGPGQLFHEYFPGTVKFRMTYNYGTETKTHVHTAGGSTLTFQTGLVVLQFSGAIEHGVGGWPRYTGPTEMLPVAHRFRFKGCGVSKELVFTPTAGAKLEKSVVVCCLLSSTGGGLADGFFRYRFGRGSYTDMGSTDASGRLIYAIDGLWTDVKFLVIYKGASLEKEQNIRSNSCVVFNTVPLTAKLLNSSGGDITSQATFDYRYGWGSYQPFIQGIELLPVATKVRVNFRGASVEKEQDVGRNPNFVFNTVAVTAQLLDSTGANITSQATFDYRLGSGSYQPFTQGIELLPVSWKVRVNFRGASVEKEQNVGTNPNFVFNTVPVTAQLLDSTGADITSQATFDYRLGRGSHQPFTQGIELLPVSWKVRVNFRGASVEKEQNVGTNPHFVFQTGSVVSQSGTCTHYRYGWGTKYPFSQGMEFLPVAVKFTFNDGTPETQYNIVAGQVNYIH